MCGVIGLALALILALALTARRGLSLWMMLGISLAAVITFLGLSLAVKGVTGRETLVYYYDEFAVFLAANGLLHLLRQPVLAYLDATLLGVGAFLACGRVGCLLVGCCHGRPGAWGVCYREEHAQAGFSPYLVGVHLFPIQAVEAIWVAGVVIIGAGMVWNGAPPGAGLAWYGVAYGLGRFVFEFFRGDPLRPYYAGFSEAQWISLLQLTGISVAEATGQLPFQAWHLAAAAILAGILLILFLLRRVPVFARQRLLQPRHVYEIARTLKSRPGSASRSGVSPPICRDTKNGGGIVVRENLF